MALELWRPRRGLARSNQGGGGGTGSLSRSERQMDDVLDRFFRDFSTLGTAGDGRWAPAIDLIDKKDEVVVRADLPGLSEKDVDLQVQDHTLFLRGQRAEEREEEDEDYYYAERWEGAFTRSIQLPAGVDTDKVKATYKNGVLEVHIPKTKEAQGRKIDITG